jgi:hypothetical protein
MIIIAIIQFAFPKIAASFNNSWVLQDSLLGKLTLPESDDLPLYPMHNNLQLTHIMYEMTESRFSFYAANPLSLFLLFLEGFSSEPLWALVF